MKDKHDLSLVLAHYGRTSYAKHGWQAIRCVMHDDKHASAAVNLDECQYACHACMFQGDVYDLIQRIEQVEYQDAVKRAEAITDGARTQVRGKRKQRDSLIPAQPRHNKRGSSGFFTRNGY